MIEEQPSSIEGQIYPFRNAYPLYLLGMHPVSKRLRYNDERQLRAMLTLETAHIFSTKNAATNLGWKSFRQELDWGAT